MPGNLASCMCSSEHHSPATHGHPPSFPTRLLEGGAEHSGPPDALLSTHTSAPPNTLPPPHSTKPLPDRPSSSETVLNGDFLTSLFYSLGYFFFPKLQRIHSYGKEKAAECRKREVEMQSRSALLRPPEFPAFACGQKGPCGGRPYGASPLAGG